MYAIKTTGLVKQYKNITAVNQLNLEIKQGELFSLLGINGAGKTTAIKMLSCLTKPTAGEAFALGCGVCQDYAHILIALCRAKGIAARYVAGMIFGEGATHAWVEIYDNGIWHGLDPTQNKRIDDGYIKLAQGRDSRDCQLNRGVFCGTAIQQQNIYVTLEDLL